MKEGFIVAMLMVFAGAAAIKAGEYAGDTDIARSMPGVNYVDLITRRDYGPKQIYDRVRPEGERLGPV